MINEINRNNWLFTFFPKEVAEHIHNVINDEENPLGEYAGDFCFYTVGNRDQKHYFDQTVSEMCCGVYQKTIPGNLNGTPVEYVVSWSYGH